MYLIWSVSKHFTCHVKHIKKKNHILPLCLLIGSSQLVNAVIPVRYTQFHLVSQLTSCEYAGSRSSNRREKWVCLWYSIADNFSREITHVYYNLMLPNLIPTTLHSCYTPQLLKPIPTTPLPATSHVWHDTALSLLHTYPLPLPPTSDAATSATLPRA